MAYSQEQYRRAVQLLHLDIRNPSGSEVVARCCFGTHKDKKPSLNINLNKGCYHCWSCKESGTIPEMVFKLTGKKMFTFLGMGKDLDVYQSLEYPEEVYREPVIKPIIFSGTRVSYLQSSIARRYLAYRGISDEVATSAHIMYSEAFKVGSRGYSKRLIIPIYNETGLMMNAELRDVTFTSKYKCFYPDDSIKPIYEWYKLDKTKPLYFVEGLIKLLVARTYSKFSNSTCGFGSYLSEYQIKQLKEFKHIIFIIDNDNAGRKAFEDMKKLLPGSDVEALEILNKPKFAHLPPLKDIDEIPTTLGMTVEQFDLEEKGFQTFSSGVW